MIDLYTWPTPNGHKVHIMLEEIAYDYNVHPVNIGEGEQFEQEFLKISPNNKMPAMVDHGAFHVPPLRSLRDFLSAGDLQPIGFQSNDLWRR